MGGGMASRQHTISHLATNPPKKQLKITGKPKRMLPKCLFTEVKTQHFHFPPTTSTHPQNHRASARLDGVMLPQRQPKQLFPGGTRKKHHKHIKQSTAVGPLPQIGLLCLFQESEFRGTISDTRHTNLAQWRNLMKMSPGWLTDQGGKRKGGRTTPLRVKYRSLHLNAFGVREWSLRILIPNFGFLWKIQPSTSRNN